MTRRLFGIAQYPQRISKKREAIDSGVESTVARREFLVLLLIVERDDAFHVISSLIELTHIKSGQTRC